MLLFILQRNEGAEMPTAWRIYQRINRDGGGERQNEEKKQAFLQCALRAFYF